MLMVFIQVHCKGLLVGRLGTKILCGHKDFYSKGDSDPPFCPFPWVDFKFRYPQISVNTSQPNVIPGQTLDPVFAIMVNLQIKQKWAYKVT